MFQLKSVLCALAAAALIASLAPGAAAGAATLPDTVVSPDGKRIAWVSEDGKSVWSAKRRGPHWGSPERLLTIRGTAQDLAFSPDSRSIAFENPRGDHGFIAVFRIGDDRVGFVDPSFGTDSDPVWSADGRRISFVRRVEGAPDAQLTRPVREPERAPDWRRSRPFSLESALAAPFVNQLTRSGDGRTVAYAAREAEARAIYLLAVGERAERVVDYPGDDGQELAQLAVSEHGGAVAYVRGGAPNSDGEIPNPESLATPPRRQVWIVAAGGGSPRLLGDGSSPRFSPADDRVVWLAGQSLMSAQLTWRHGRLRDVGSPEPLFSFQGSISMLRFSPDGRRIAYQRAGGIELLDLATRTTSAIAHPGASDAAPSWSPGGDRIAFRRTVSGQPFAIWVADVSSLHARPVWQAEPGLGSAFYGLDQEDQLLWSADDRIAFAWERDGWRHLYSVPAAGGSATLLTPGAGEVEQAAPSADRERLVYSTNIGDQARRHVATVGFDGMGAAPLTGGRASQWAPTPLADDRLAYIHAGWSDPPAVRVRDRSGSTATASLPRVPRSFPDDDMVEPRPVEFAASDGQTAYGELFVPRRAEGCAIVFPHGGPRRQMLPGFHYIDVYTNLYELNQYLASQGCVVLSVEYRSGIMYGHAFRNAPEIGRAGASEYRDILGAVAYLQNRPDVDPERLGIYGLSWGGYIAALGLARNSDIFKVGFDMAGVHEFFGAAFPFSPAADIDRWTSPVYLAQGDDDRNVDFSQGVILDRLLKSRRPGVEYVQRVFPDETHDMYLTFDHLVDLYQEGSAFLLDRLQR